ncbi:hypothetical protein B0H14DRAFT_2565088 [Mycena olivaceomarginata]|nr:hypothetical protein B0H14DRAFT_2565088 [Mycena olivaceomarginata]
MTVHNPSLRTSDSVLTAHERYSRAARRGDKTKLIVPKSTIARYYGHCHIFHWENIDDIRSIRGRHWDAGIGPVILQGTELKTLDYDGSTPICGIGRHAIGIAMQSISSTVRHILTTTCVRGAKNRMAYMFCVGSARYDDHVRITPERKQRSNCNNHRAVNETNIKRKEVDSTGIGACAFVGFKKGEKSLSAAPKRNQGVPPDIQYFLSRFMDGKYLFYREDLKLSAAVGKFHLETHILECFWEFTWKAPASLMAKSLRHCGPLSIKSLGAQEACHVHIARSGNLVISKMDRAQDGLVSVQEAFEQLSARIGDSVIAKWKEEETQALAHGGVGRKIYKAEAVESPGIAETCLRLTEAEKKARGEDVARAWDNEEIEDEAQSTSAVLAEKMRLSLPSNLKKGNIESHIFSHLCEQEAKLCEGQINESAARLSSPSA